jgi:hypothetical protein
MRPRAKFLRSTPAEEIGNFAPSGLANTSPRVSDHVTARKVHDLFGLEKVVFSTSSVFENLALVQVSRSVSAAAANFQRLVELQTGRVLFRSHGRR